MRLALTPHPDTPCRAVASLDAEIARLWKHAIEVRYLLRGDLAAIRFPAPAEPKHVDGLWQTTCFEAFLRDPGSEGYCEVNFSPSTEFAIYEFDGYRSGMKGGHCCVARISTNPHADGLELHGMLNFQRCLQVRGDGPLLVGLTAVIEETNGAKSYWALKHAPGKPDFHHPDSFAIELPTAERP